MAQHNEIGQQGEAEAASYLLAEGYEVVARNVRYQHAEIDIVVRKNRLLIFVEVKTRTTLSYGNPEEFVSYEKAKLVMRAAERYIFAHDWLGDVRFDIVAVSLAGDTIQIKHIEDAFC